MGRLDARMNVENRKSEASCSELIIPKSPCPCRCVANRNGTEGEWLRTNPIKGLADVEKWCCVITQILCREGYRQNPLNSDDRLRICIRRKIVSEHHGQLAVDRVF